MGLINQLSLSILLFTLAITAHGKDSIWDKSKVDYFGPSNITVYRDPGCGCCEEWIKHLEKNNFTVKEIKTNNVQAIKQEQNIAPELASCHTAIVEGYAIEGHVPADDIKKLLIDKPEGVIGLTVPRMPTGTPGMEMGNRKDPFKVLQINKDGTTQTFSEYLKY
ncbi:DUF411 domain-containing protein [Candidatus Nitrosacidococcus sp. I8]|uniref:DUF411 domain-containing protein n=1 Tax=Candidatus Nitrosacidococcus sp. I8 TaxID=2942908 RepID=UPI002225DA89|nr:DUF411 domain-containing protein [Candidatus Nitrosacidococcus sp. I8]CAH9017648.1 hypothetical protein NURINAE_00476 [Candidatus Nitrosacidococcus sp. I8]